MTMEMETSDGYLASNGNCSPRKENPRMLVDLSTNTPNGQHSQSPVSPTEHSIKQEEVGEEEERRVSGAEEMSHGGGVGGGEEGSGPEEPMIDSPGALQDMGPATDGPHDSNARLPNGDRPFQCSQCGVSFTQKGNLLRHIKLHTGEKPFKCPFCNYACRRRDALTGHLRTHSVGKPHKCTYCGRSYKQRTSLEEHKERCHNYLQSVGMDSTSAAHYPEVSKESWPKIEPSNIVPFERPPVIERLQGNVGKRKSTTPQKFVGEKMLRYSYPDINFDMGLKYEKEAEQLMQAHMMDQAINVMPFLSSDSLRPMVHHPPLPMSEVVPMVNSLFHPVYPAGPRMDRPSSRGTPPPPHPQPQPQPPPPLPRPPPEFHPSSNGAISLVRPKHHHHPHHHAGRDGSPSNSAQESVDSARSSPRDRSGAPGRSRTSPGGLMKGEADGRLGEAAALARAASAAVRDGVRVFSREGQELRAFQCEHCRVLFLDHVMYTIHMGCHGYRDPLECNICGHCSKDRYEFSSHIVRGEHTFQ
ncbi:zinc finger protein Helios isoform X2 [Engraulis encrasicolus]